MHIMRLTTPPLKCLSSISRSSFFTILSRPIYSTTPNLDQTEPKSTNLKPQRERSAGLVHGAIDASSSVRKPTSLWPGRYDSPVTNALWEARSSIFERPVDGPAKEAPSQSELLIKTPSQSRASVIYQFSTDYVLREQYRDPGNEVRIGKLLEDLDALAGTIAFKERKRMSGAIHIIGYGANKEERVKEAGSCCQLYGPKESNVLLGVAQLLIQKEDVHQVNK